MISSVVATADHVKALKRSDKELTLSFDEWNVWYQQHFPGELGLDIREVSPLIEDIYTVDDAVVVGSLLITLLRHADRGLIPPGYKLGALRRWDAAELEAFIASGCKPPKAGRR